MGSTAHNLQVFNSLSNQCTTTPKYQALAGNLLCIKFIVVLKMFRIESRLKLRLLVL